MQLKQQLFQRYEGNPILVPGQWPHTVNAVFNPGAVGFVGDTCSRHSARATETGLL